jgi:hypothetical protein
MGTHSTKFLFHIESNLEYKFYATRPNAKQMFHTATHEPCPLGILQTADYCNPRCKSNYAPNFFFIKTAPQKSKFLILAEYKQNFGLPLLYAQDCGTTGKILNKDTFLDILTQHQYHSFTLSQN